MPSRCDINNTYLYVGIFTRANIYRYKQQFITKRVGEIYSEIHSARSKRYNLIRTNAKV